MKIVPTLCIYHGNCADGFGAAWAVWKKYPHIQFHAGFYGETPPDCEAHNVVLVDFSYKQDVMREIIGAARSVTVIDHHKTAVEELTPLFDEDVIDGIFDMDKSGAVLAWEWFHPGEPTPALLAHIQDRDLWKFELPMSKEIHAGLTSYPFDFSVWDNLILDKGLWKPLIDMGGAILRKQMADIESLIEGGKRTMIIGPHVVPVVNMPPMWASDAGHLICKDPDVLFSATYYDKKDARVFSLRSVGDFDVSEIAKLYGGGGHKNAAGFSVDLGGWGDDCDDE